MRKLGLWCALFVLAICLQELGAGANRLVMSSNDNRMPVVVLGSLERVFLEQSDRHCPLTIHSRFLLLSDIFVHPVFHGLEMEIDESSIGDTLLDLGGTIWVLLPFLPLFWFGRWIWRTK